MAAAIGFPRAADSSGLNGVLKIEAGAVWPTWT